MKLQGASAGKIIAKIQKKVNQTIFDYQLIKPNDKILVGLSGGKDSITLLDVLTALQRKLPFQFEIKAVHIQSKAIPYTTDIDLLKQFCDERGVVFETTTVDYSTETDSRKTPCYVCAVHRRNALFAYSREQNMNKIALGHNLTDSIGTLMMNMIFHGSISAIPPNLHFFGGDIQMIRPLIAVSEEEVKLYIAARQFNVITKNCEFADSTSRNKIKLLIEQMENIYPDAQQSIRKSMSAIFPEYLIADPKFYNAQ